MINQILKEVLLDPDETTDARKESIDFARTDYENNQEQLEYIQQLEENYWKENTFEYFQQKQFLYKVNRRSSFENKSLFSDIYEHRIFHWI